MSVWTAISTLRAIPTEKKRPERYSWYLFPGSSGAAHVTALIIFVLAISLDLVATERQAVFLALEGTHVIGIRV
jgi:hypothetical protein